MQMELTVILFVFYNECKYHINDGRFLTVSLSKDIFRTLAQSEVDQTSTQTTNGLTKTYVHKSIVLNSVLNNVSKPSEIILKAA